MPIRDSAHAKMATDTGLVCTAVLVGSVKLAQMDRAGMEDRVYRYVLGPAYRLW